MFILFALFVSEDALAGSTVYPMLVTGVLGVVGLTAYVYYLDFVHKKPNFLLYFVIILQPILIFLCSTLVSIGINPHTHLWLILLVMIPAGLFAPQVFRFMGKDYFFVKAFIIFFLFATAYYLFNNHAVIDPRFDHSGSLSGGSTSLEVLRVYAYFASSMIMTIFAIKSREFTQDAIVKLNNYIAISVITYSILAIMAYFSNITMVELEGVKRVALIFGHPNPFAFYMGLMMLYLFGSGMLGITSQDKKINGFWILSALIGIVGFLTAMSKTSILGLGASVFFFMMVAFLKRPGIKAILVTVCLLLLVGLLQALDTPLMGTLSDRFERNNSLEWRLEAWRSVLYSLKPESIPLGKGFSASNEVMLDFQLLQSEMTPDLKKSGPVIKVHNAFISNLYDFGLIGLLPLFALLLLVLKGMKHIFSFYNSKLSNVYTIIAGSIIYYFGICFFDLGFECLLLPFWPILILIYSQLPAIQEKRLSNVC